MTKMISYLSVITILWASIFASAAIPVLAARPSSNLQAPLDSESLSVVGQIGGVATAVTAQDGMLYFNIGPRMGKMATTTPSTPTKPAVYGDLLPGIPEDIQVANGYLYLAMGENGVAIVDANTLALAAAVKLPGNATAYAVAVGAQRLYVAAGELGIVSYALGAANNSLTDQNVKTMAPVNSITDVAVGTTGTTVYLYAGGAPEGLIRYDITSTFIPTDANALAAPAAANIVAIHVTATKIFASTWEGLSVFDPSTLALVGSTAVDTGLLDLAFVADKDILYAVNSIRQIEVLDVSVPASPIHLNVGTPISASAASYTYGIAAISSGIATILYAADFELGLDIFYAATTPEEILLSEPGYVQSELAVVDQVGDAASQAFAYANYSHLATVNVTDPSMPALVGAGILPADTISALTREQNMLLAAAGSAGLLRYQIVPGDEPTPDGVWDTTGSSLDVAVVWPNALVADGINGLLVININGTMDMIARTTEIVDSSFDLVDVKPTLAVVYDTLTAGGTLRIYDLTDLTDDLNPRGTLEVAGVLDLLISGDYVFLATGDDGVKVVNIANPDAPVLVGSGYDTPGFAMSLAALNSSLYVADSEAGVHMLAIQLDGSLQFKVTAETAGIAEDLSVATGDTLYVADDLGGLVMMQSLVIAPESYTIFLPLINR